MLKKIKNENGLVIVEAAIVFPVMFFVLLFIIFIGNMYFEQAKIDNIVKRNAISGAEYIADAFLYDMDNGKTVPTNVKDLKIEPYKYIFGSISNGTISKIEDKISQNVKNEINNGSLVLFDNQNVKILGSDNKKIAMFNNYVLYSTFVVQVNYEIKFPIKFLGEEAPTIFKFSSRSEVAVNDVPEFIRNVDMVVDLLDGTKTSENIKGFFDKINKYLEKFSK